MISDDDIIDAILLREGGYVDLPADRGGPTNWGITLATLNEWRQSLATANDVKTLTEAEARKIYRAMYLERPGLDKIASPELRAVLLDAAINHGPKWAIKFLQRALKIQDDGVIGDVTLAAVPHLQPQKLGLKIMCERIKYYGAIVKHDPSQSVFILGWMNRCAELIEDLA
jgi:lysozyme family protein